MTKNRLMQFVLEDPNRGCWLWQGCVDNGGYGRFFYNGKARKAHRISYEMFRCSIPTNREIDHLCRNRRCINPWHLEPVTRNINILRGEHIGPNIFKTHCPHGHPYSKENTWRSKTGTRFCKTCNREQKRHTSKHRREHCHSVIGKL